MMQHEESQLISAYLDKELSASEAAHVATHLASCTDCRAHLTSLRATKSIFAACGRRALPPDLIIQLEHSLTPRPWLQFSSAFMGRPAILSGTAVALAVMVASLWWGMRIRTESEVPLEALLAAHSRYTAETLIPETNLVASNYSTLDYGDRHENQD